MDPVPAEDPRQGKLPKKALNICGPEGILQETSFGVI
jgi:hypothetical protein